MTKNKVVAPEAYKGKDAVDLKCMSEYVVKGGSGGVDVKYEKGKTYAFAPRSAAHMLRKMMAVRKPDAAGKLRYAGDAPVFVNEKAEAEQAKAAPAAKAAKAGDGDK